MSMRKKLADIKPIHDTVVSGYIREETRHPQIVALPLVLAKTILIWYNPDYDGLKIIDKRSNYQISRDLSTATLITKCHHKNHKYYPIVGMMTITTTAEWEFLVSFKTSLHFGVFGMGRNGKIKTRDIGKAIGKKTNHHYHLFRNDGVGINKEGQKRIKYLSESIVKYESGDLIKVILDVPRGIISMIRNGARKTMDINKNYNPAGYKLCIGFFDETDSVKIKSFRCS